MVLRVSNKFTPEVLLSLPRRSAGIPNSAGTLILSTTSTYDFKSHTKTTVVNVLDVATSESITLAKDEKIADLVWLNDQDVAYLKAADDGSTSVCVANVDVARGGSGLSSVGQVAGTIDASAGDLKVVPLNLQRSEFAVVVSATSNPDGSLYTTAKAKRETRSTGKLYDGLFVRHWDSYETREKNSLWYGKLTRLDASNYTLSELRNALVGLDVECPIKPFGGSDNFDVSHSSIILVTKDPDLNPALNTKCAAWLLHFDSWDQETKPTAIRIKIPEIEGALTGPVFDASGQKAAFLAMKAAGYEADRNRIFVLSNIHDASASISLTPVDLSHWDRSPQSLIFSEDGQDIFLVAEDIGRSRLFAVSDWADGSTPRQPRQLTDNRNISGVARLDEGRLFIHGSSLVDNSWYAILDLGMTSKSMVQAWQHSNSQDGAKFGLNAGQVSWIWTPASNPKINREVHSLVVRPSWYSKKDAKKLPVAYLIHGGPQGAWTDSWSTRWNPAVFAEQGYIVVAPNPTGSTGYGQAFTDAIQQNWGGDPYQDIVNVFEWVGKNIAEADNDRAVALGASYGGYMMNWIQGHDLGRQLKALVCHDGNYSLSGTMLATEELYFPFHEMGGLPWAKDKSAEKSETSSPVHPFSESGLSNWQRWDPSRFADQWSTPQLIIHSEKDYRLTISEGLAAFNVLQTRGVPSQFLTFPDENHWVLNPENSLAWHKVVLNWINHYADLPAYTQQSPKDEEFWGGVKEE